MAYVKIKGGCIFAYCGREKDKMGEFRNKKQTPINERKITDWNEMSGKTTKAPSSKSLIAFYRRE